MVGYEERRGAVSLHPGEWREGPVRFALRHSIVTRTRPQEALPGAVCERLRDLIPPPAFQIAIQGRDRRGAIIARETIGALRPFPWWQCTAAGHFSRKKESF